MLKEYFKNNTLLYQYIYSTLFPKYFCRVDDYGIKSKLAFEVAHAGYKNQRESLRFVQLQPQLPTEVKQEQKEIVDEVAMVEVVKSAPPSKSTAAQKSIKKKDKRKPHCRKNLTEKNK